MPWACHYDANMEPWSPFKDTPEVPVIRPRTAMLMMRKMLLSNPAAGQCCPIQKKSRGPSTDRMPSASLRSRPSGAFGFWQRWWGTGLHFVLCARDAVSGQRLTPCPAAFLHGLAGQAWEAEYDSVNNKKLVSSLRRPSKPQVSALSHYHVLTIAKSPFRPKPRRAATRAPDPPLCFSPQTVRGSVSRPFLA